MKKMILALLVCLLLTACAQSRANLIQLSEQDLANAAATRVAVNNSMQSWSLNSGFIGCAFGSQIEELPASTVNSLRVMDQVTKSAGLWSETDYQIGCYLGSAVRATAATTEAVVRQIVPRLASWIPSAFLW